MGIIQKQSIRSTIIILLGFSLGAFNMLVLVPKIITPEQLGLTRLIADAAITLATLCTFGSLSVVNKFFPFYKSYLPPKKNDLPFLSLVICLVGFAIICISGYLGKDIIFRKFSERSPLFVEYSYLVYPFCLFLLLFMWMESFSWALHKSVLSNTLREVLPRSLFTVILILFFFSLLSFKSFLYIYSFSYLIPGTILFILLRKTGFFNFTTELSAQTIRLKGKMINFGLFVFGAQFLNLLSRTIDTFILSSKGSRGLTDTAVFTIATYIITLMEVPQRSMNSAAIPVIAESWKNKDLKNISHVYKRSVTNLLIIGLAMFGLIWLNINNIAGFLGKNYAGIESIVLIMGLGKLIDLGTGANGQIIGTSSFWKVDFATNVIYTILALPLNYFLISKYGLHGAAVSFLISLTFYNLLRFGFLKIKFNLQPYVIKDLFAIILAISSAAIAYAIPVFPSSYADMVVRSSVFLGIFIPLIYFSNISVEINTILKTYLNKFFSS
ncbi:lipopolysaccharide biosynthesis protein [Flavihumibacter fluvii]|uniref:lipopolysaccharide biosynthesis protein n=1 Tax=Flavihumibacter fluvii TaxID=2838157 RepID=UPI001BDF2B4C|nr:polysaccharide biosynthesis C-terminal domain-containing protein [Flavihumibacter fluvii]ULQ53779.1 polysaccharide biosynthesis C-terminal domain-containing protein [Flavihumibacter fluvii]